MYELIQVGPHTYYVNCPAKIGIYEIGDGQVWLIDSGGDKDAGRRIGKLLAEQGWTLAGIANTHAHADHIGGNATLQQRTGCPVLGPEGETALIRSPLLEPSFLYGGYPMKGLRNKFLMARPSTPAGAVEAELPEGLTALPLPGHFFDMRGFRTGDGVAFIADSVFSPTTIEKYHVFFLYDVAAFLRTLDDLEEMEAELFVPSHCEAAEDIHELTALNRAKVLEIARVILDLCQTPRSPESVLKGVFDHYGLTMDLNQYVLVGSTVRSYLSYLIDGGRLEVNFADNLPVYTAGQI